MNSRLLFLNLSVADVAASKEFFASLGFTFDQKFSNDECACMEVGEGSWVMLLHASRFADFAKRPIGEQHAATSHLVCVSAADRAGVDELAEAALAAGATPAGDPTDMGFMYGRSFYDLDGHHWEVMWMAEEAVEAGPEAAAQQLA